MLIFEKISKSFRSEKVVMGLNLEVVKGQVMGLLGPNGAGKSTSMKMAAGCLRPSSGQVLLNGIDVWKHPISAKRHLGYLPESAPLYEDFTPCEYLYFIARLRGLISSEIQYAIDASLETCHLEPVRHQLISTLSKGYRHRVCLAQCLLGDPEILIFDEPTDGLDPNQKQVVRDLINYMRPRKAIIVSTHILEEVEAVCTDVFIINHGVKTFAGTPQEFLAVSEDQSKLKVKFEGGNGQKILTDLHGLNCFSLVALSSESSVFEIQKTEPISSELRGTILKVFQERGALVCSLSNEPGRIAESFQRLTMGRSS